VKDQLISKVDNFRLCIFLSSIFFT